MHLKFCLGVFLGFVASIVAVISFNIKIDSSNIFYTLALKNAARLIIEGNKVAFVGNMDERTYQRYFIEQIEYMPECIALGSSRIMQFRERHLTSIRHNSGRFYNNGVSGANILDYYAILGLYLKYHNALPKCIIFGLDPWILNVNNGDKRYLSIEDGLKTMRLVVFKDRADSMKNGFLESSFLLKAKEAISFEQTISNVKSLMNGSYKREYFSISTNDVEYLSRTTDNSSYYPIQSRNPSRETIDKEVLGFKTYHIMNFDNLYTDDFVNLINYLRGENIELIFYLPPYHPKLYDIIVSESANFNVLKAQKFIRDYAEKHKIQIYGDYNGANLGLGFMDFLDGVHTKDTALDIIFH